MSGISPQSSQTRWRISSDSNSRMQLAIRPAVVLPILLFILSLALNLSHVETTEFHPDETRWMNRAHYFSDLRDPFGLTWEDQYITRGQPPLGSYLMGLGLVLQGRDTDTNNVWDFSYGTSWNEMNGAMPSEADLEAGRRTNAVVGAVTVVVVFFFVNAIGGLLAAGAAGLLMALHPLQIWLSSQALSDPLFVMLVALALLTAVKLTRQPTRVNAVLLGVLLGLGGATKLSPLLLAFTLAGYGIALLVLAHYGRVDTRKAQSLGPLLMLQPAIAIGTFILSYPYLWPAPLERSWNLFELRAQEMTGQSLSWPGVSVDNPIEALGRVYQRLTWQFSTTGNILETIVGWFRSPVDIWGFDLVFAIIGIVALARLIFVRGLTSGAALAGFLLAGQVGVIVVGMQVDFYRYHLPIVLAVSILFGLSVSLIWHALSDRGAARYWNLVPGVSLEALAPAGNSSPTGRRTETGSTDPIPASDAGRYRSRAGS